MVQFVLDLLQCRNNSFTPRTASLSANPPANVPAYLPAYVPANDTGNNSFMAAFKECIVDQLTAIFPDDIIIIQESLSDDKELNSIPSLIGDKILIGYISDSSVSPYSQSSIYEPPHKPLNKEKEKSPDPNPRVALSVRITRGSKHHHHQSSDFTESQARYLKRLCEVSSAVLTSLKENIQKLAVQESTNLNQIG
jgi:hypothetical protein